MTGISRFEDLAVWRRARRFTSSVYNASGEGTFAKDFGLRDQIRRASVSIMANLAEGFDRAQPRQFQYFLTIAKASCAEAQSHLYVARDAGFLSAEELDALLEEGRRLGRAIGALRSAVKRYGERTNS
jgi:four helix bundle protein